MCLWNAKLYTQLDSGNTTCPLIFCDYLCGIPKSWCVLYTQPHSGNITRSRPSLRRLCLAGIRLGVCIFCGPRNLAFLQMQYWNSNDQSHGNWDFWMFCRDHAPLGVRSISTQVVRNRMKSVKNIQKITKAMKMVAASKLRLIQTRAENSRGLWQPFTALLGDSPSMFIEKFISIHCFVN